MDADKRNRSHHDTQHLDIVLWLPAGKSNFGDMTNTDSLRMTEADRSIAGKIHWMFTTNIEDLQLAIAADYHTRHNGLLGCRELEINFCYTRSPYLSDDLVHQFLVLSNGLYRWRLFPKSDVTLTPELSRELAEEFLLNHIYRFFHHEWSKSALVRAGESQSRNPRDDTYRGALSFFQRELLFEGPFNVSLLPSFYLLADKSGAVNDFNRNYRLDTVLKAIICFSSPEEGKTVYRITTDRQVRYSVERAEASALRGSSAGELTRDDEEKEVFQQLLVAAEHFLRYSTAVGVLPILEGVQNVQRELLERGVRSATSLSPLQVRTREQAAEMIDASSLMIESYFRLLKTKYPVLAWLDILIDDLVTSSDKFQVLEGRRRRENGDEILVHDPAGQTYRAAKGQFKRILALLRDNIDAIESTVLLGHGDSEVRLLSDILRLNEFMFEAQGDQEVRVGEVALGDEERHRLVTGLSTIAVFAGALAGVVPLMLGLIAILWGDATYSQMARGGAAGALALVVMLLILLWRKPRGLYKALYRFAGRMFGSTWTGKEKAVDVAEANIEQRVMISLRINRRIKTESFDELVADFWKEIQEISAREPEKSRLHSDRFIDRPNDDTRRIKLSLKKAALGGGSVRAKFSIYLELVEYERAASTVLQSVVMLVFGSATVTQDAGTLANLITNRDFFDEPGYQGVFRQNILNAIGKR